MVKFGGHSGEQLRQLVSKIENLENEKKQVSEYISDAFKEAKAQGYDVKVLRKLISIRKKDQNQLAEEESILATYMHAMGMVAGYEEDSEEVTEDKKAA